MCFFSSFLLKLFLEEIRLPYLQTQHFTFFQFTRISETISFRAVENIFLTLTDRDQLSCIEYDYTYRIFVFCCDSTWLLPYKQPWSLKKLFSQWSLECTFLEIISFRSWHFNSTLWVLEKLMNSFSRQSHFCHILRMKKLRSRERKGLPNHQYKFTNYRPQIPSTKNNKEEVAPYAPLITLLPFLLLCNRVN